MNDIITHRDVIVLTGVFVLYALIIILVWSFKRALNAAIKAGIKNDAELKHRRESK